MYCLMEKSISKTLRIFVLSTIVTAHSGIYLTSSFRDLDSIPTVSLDLYHFLGPLTNRIEQSIYLRFGVTSMKRYSDSTSAPGNCWIFYGEGTKRG